MLVPLTDLVARLPRKSREERKVSISAAPPVASPGTHGTHPGPCPQLLRVAYYLLCRCLAAHAASLPSAVSGRLVSAWTAAVGSGASDGDASHAGAVHCVLAALAAACAGGVQGAGSALATCTQGLLPNAQLLRKKGKLFGGASEVSGLPARDDGAGAAVVPSHRSALGAARRAQELPPPWGSRTASGSALSSASLLVGLCSADAIAARHAMAVRALAPPHCLRSSPDSPLSWLRARCTPRLRALLTRQHPWLRW